MEAQLPRPHCLLRTRSRRHDRCATSCCTTAIRQQSGRMLLPRTKQMPNDDASPGHRSQRRQPVDMTANGATRWAVKEKHPMTEVANVPERDITTGFPECYSYGRPR